MTLAELFVLNRAVDGQDICGVPSFADLRMSNPRIDTVKASLMKKGLLETADSFTAEGAAAARTLQRYKAAEKYTSIGPVTVGLSPNGATALWHNPMRKDYVFSDVALSQIREQLLAQYPFLAQGTPSPADNAAETVRKADFAAQSKNFAGRMLTLEGYTAAGGAQTKDTVYREGGCLYHYNWMTESRRKIDKEDALRLLEEGLTV